jgi:hypothetical protein
MRCMRCVNGTVSCGMWGRLSSVQCPACRGTGYTSGPRVYGARCFHCEQPILTPSREVREGLAWHLACWPQWEAKTKRTWAVFERCL